MLVSGIKSRPVYGGLNPQPPAKRHLIVAEGEGALAIAELMALASNDFRSRATILYVTCGSTGPSHTQMLQSLGVDECHFFPTIQTMMFRLTGILSTSTMGTRLHVSGTEGFIGQVVQLALSHHMDHHSIATEHRGSLARRVQCVHCKGITNDVTTNIAKCAHCGLNLLVRDHYSRRLGAFMGVAVDAEAPGELPPIQEIYR
jgi:hypothetical protein